MEFEHHISRILGSSFFKRAFELDALREGLVVSYGSNSLKSDLFRLFNDFITAVEDVPLLDTPKTYKYGKPNTVTILVKNPEQFKKHHKGLDRILVRQGYSLISHSIYSDDLDLYQFEPKYPVTINKEYLKGYRIFHVTEADRANKILQRGLNAKQSRTSFAHTGNRIYLFATNNPSKHLPVLSKRLSERITDKGSEHKHMVSFEVDPAGISNEELYLDESFEFKPNAYCDIFTLFPVRPNYLKIYEHNP
jgi:hypothetical protein